MSTYGTPPSSSSPYGEAPQPPQAGDAKGFFGALFDFSFSHFVTPMIVKFVYALTVVALVLGWLFFLVTGFATDPSFGLLVLVLGPIVLLVYLAFIRMTLEFYLAVVRMSEDVHHRLPR